MTEDNDFQNCWRGDKILIVDDDPVHNEVLCDILCDSYKLEIAISYEDALGKLIDFNPDLILLDIMLPDRSGLNFCEELKETFETESVPVIFISGRLGLEDKVAGFNAGGADYITKPFEIEEVLARVETHLKLRRALRTINSNNDRLEELLKERTAELIKSERKAAFSLMIQGIIHNLCGPLTGMLMNVGTLRHKMTELMKFSQGNDCNATCLENMENMMEFLDLSLTCCDNMNQMLNVLMTKSYSEKSYQMEKVDLNKFLRNEIKFHYANISFKHNIDKKILLSEGALEVRAIPGEIAQVFQNLVNNAVDALKNKSEARISFSSGIHDRKAWFSVADNGPGIPENTILKIFDPFFSTKKKEEKETERTGGLGLGLYSCQEIIKTYSGTIEIDNVIGEGVEFKVYLPLA